MKLETPYEGETKVLHYLEVLRDRVGFDNVREKVITSSHRKEDRRLLWLSAAPPRKDPGSLMIRRIRRLWRTLIRALGAEPVIYPYRNECCGGYVSLKDKEPVRKRCADKIMESRRRITERKMLITACPLCHVQSEEEHSRSAKKLPVYYFTELLAEALG